MRFGTVTDVQPGICTVKVAGGEIPVIYLKGGAPTKGEFVAVHRQGVVSYLFNPPTLGALWVGDSGLFGIWRVPTSGQDPVFYPIYGEPITGVVEGPDKAIWACSSSTVSYVWRMESSGPQIGNVSEVQLPSAAPTGICVGPDGNLWVSDSNGYVWKVTTGLVATPYALPGSAPYAIASGSDGNLWVVDEGGAIQSVWRVTPQGATTQFLLDSNASPSGLALGSDGNIWVADQSGRVWRVTPNGTRTPFPVGNTPVEICSGPSGDLWVLDAINAVLQVNTSGSVVNSFPLPGGTGAEGTWYAITQGPDGNLWIAQALAAGGSAVKMTPAGVVTPYTLTSTGAPTSICSGP